MLHSTRSLATAPIPTEPSSARPTGCGGRSPPRIAARLAVPLLLCAAWLVAGCGSRHHAHEGFVLVDNRTDLTTNEFLVAFRLAPFGHPFTGDLLASDIAPGATRNLGAWAEEFYDAEADLELGELVEWFDIFVGHQETTVFEAQ